MVKRLIAAIIYLILPAIALSQATPFVLKGKVVDINAQPIAGAEVAAYETFFHSAVEESKPLADIVRTDSKGNFEINVKIESQIGVFIIVRKDGFALGWDILSSSSINKAEGKFNIVIERPQVLAGRLLNEMGEGISNITIEAVVITSNPPRLSQRRIDSPKQWLTTQTDEEGNFVFKNFAEDVSATFLVKVPGREITYRFTPHPVSSAGYEVGKKDVRLILPLGAKIEGRVIDKGTGKGASNIDLQLSPDYLSKNEYFYFPIQATSDADGKFTINNVPPGNHNLELLIKPNELCEWISKTKAVEIKPQETQKEISFAVEKGGFIEAIVFDKETQRPVSGVSLNVSNSNYSDGRRAYSFRRAAITNADGIARIAAPAGKCVIEAWKEKSYSQNTFTIAVIKNRTSPIKILLTRNNLSVNGIILDQSNKPVSGANVSIHPFGCHTLTDNTGSFAANKDFSFPADLLYVRDESRNLAAAVKIKNASKPIKTVLEPGLTLKGTICDTGGRPIPAARLSLILALPTYFLAGPDIEVLTDAEGRFTINAIAPPEGKFTYRYSVAAPDYGPIEYGKVSIDGRAGETIDIGTIKLRKADESISGFVVDAQGRPVAGIPVFTHTVMDSAQPNKTTVTDSEGRFVFNRICKGPVRIQANFSMPGDTSNSGSRVVNGGDKDVKVVIGKRDVITKSAEKTEN